MTIDNMEAASGVVKNLVDAVSLTRSIKYTKNKI